MLRLASILLLFTLFATARAAEISRTYYVQIIRGTDSDEMIPASYHSVGPKLAKRLSPVFRWKHYWEVSQQTVSIQRGKPARVRISDGRLVEVELVSEGTTEVRLIRDGKQVRKSRQSADEKISIMGWEERGNESWFVAVRREKPQ